MSDQLRLTALAVAKEEAGKGAREVGGNNSGPWVAKYLDGRAAEGTPWCAAFVSWCVREACHRLGVQPAPFEYDLMARGILRQCKKKGWLVDGDPLPGDLVVWSRGGRGSGQGHIGFVEFAHDGLMQTIEGNHDAVVHSFHYEWKHETRLLGFVRVP